MHRIMRVFLFSLLCSLFFAAPPLWALWIDDGTPVCTVAESQSSPQVVSDGAGGAIITWQDHRDGKYDTYAQRVDASGIARWSSGGVILCTAAGDQFSPQIISDGAGGAIVTWYDYRSGDSNIYVQRIDGAGIIQWNISGAPLCTATGGQYSPEATSDGAGGAIVTWYDYRNGNYDIYVQRVDASGMVQWASNGLALCTSAEDQIHPQITSDGAGGAIITWYDYRNGNYDIYAQRVDATGVFQWTANGVAICTATWDQSDPQITSDGTGGAIITWEDNRSLYSKDVYVQRIDASGTVQWTSDGVALCTATEDQVLPKVVSDGAGGVIVAWEDHRSGDSDIYAQRIDSAGAVQWTSNGVALCTAAGIQYVPQIITEGTGGAIVTWDDYRSGNWNVYVQRVDSAGAVQWTSNGVALCTAVENQTIPQVASDGAGGAIVTWDDHRNGNYDIYLQQIDSRGRIGYLPPVIHSVSDVPGDEGGYVNLTWDATVLDYLSGDITEYTIWRALDTQTAQNILQSGGALVSSPAKLADPELENHQEPVLRLDSLNGAKAYWELIATVQAYRLQGYSEIAPTLFDSTAACSGLHYFQVIAHTGYSAVFFVSDPDSGYSVDNLSPAAPAKLAGDARYEPLALQLSWAPNHEPDMGQYRVYRGLSEDFVPGPGSLIASTSDTTSVDPAWTPGGGYYYKVSATDIHGNESPFSLLAPGQAAGTELQHLPSTAILHQNVPNPFNPTTTLAFDLPVQEEVNLRVFDLQGRLVRTLIDAEVLGQGRHEIVWDGRDGTGRQVASGTYFYRLEVGGKAVSRRMAMLK